MVWNRIVYNNATHGRVISRCNVILMNIKTYRFKSNAISVQIIRDQPIRVRVTREPIQVQAQLRDGALTHYRVASTWPWRCIGFALDWHWHGSGVALAWPWRCVDVAVALSWRGVGSGVACALHWCCIGVASCWHRGGRGVADIMAIVA